MIVTHIFGVNYLCKLDGGRLLGVELVAPVGRIFLDNAILACQKKCVLGTHRNRGDIYCSWIFRT